MDDNIQLLVKTDKEMSELIQKENNERLDLLRRAKLDAQVELKIMEKKYVKKLEEEKSKLDAQFKQIEQQEKELIDEEIEKFNRKIEGKREKLVEMIFKEITGFK